MIVRAKCKSITLQKAHSPMFDIHDVMQPQFSLREIGDRLWSALPPDRPTPEYDGRARLYDLLVGSRIYNRLAWGVSPQTYEAFAASAKAAASGPFLDAGCGTLVSTVHVHARSRRPTVLLDLSRDMLLAAQRRLVAEYGCLPDHLFFLQADLMDLPLAKNTFETIISPGMVHLFEDIESFAAGLARVAKPGFPLFLSSLVSERTISRLYLHALHRAGEVARPRTGDQVLTRLRKLGPALTLIEDARLEGSVLFAKAVARN